jgi:putative transposase
MLTDDELLALFDKLNTPERGRQLIRWIRENSPVRAVDGSAGNNTVRYTSHKMGFVLECEASHTEYAAAITWDFDDETLEFYSQPAHLKLTNQLPSGRRSTFHYTPDFFRITRTGFQFIECKMEEDLLKLAKEKPYVYAVDEHGRWRRASAEQAALPLGAEFKVRSSAENQWALIENINFLRDYIVWKRKDDVAQQQALREFVAKGPWFTIESVLDGLPGIADTLYAEIATGRLAFDLVADRLTNRDRALIFRDSQSASAYKAFARSKTSPPQNSVVLELTPGTRFDWDGRPWEVVNVGDTAVACRSLAAADATSSEFIELAPAIINELSQQGKIIPHPASRTTHHPERIARIQRASERQLRVAVERYNALFHPDKKSTVINRCKRARSYWLASYRKAEALYGYGFIGLVPNPDHTQGNKERKLLTPVLEILETAFNSDWTPPKQKTNSAIWGKVIKLCEEKGLDAPSRKTFAREIARLKTSQALVDRLGNRMAYGQVPIPTFWSLEYTTPVHGTHPFHIAHLDHTKLTIRLVARDTRREVGTIWLSMLLCAYSRKVLAYYLSFDEPSYRSCMMVIRDCVRWNGRVPQVIVVDKGPEFNSIYFEQLLAELRCDKLSRPAARPRGGAPIESFFNVTQEAFLFNLMGNTQAERHLRKVSKAVSPSKLAMWTYERFSLRLEQYFNEVYHAHHHSTLGCSPMQQFNMGLETTGPRKHVYIPYTEAFLMLTRPSTRKGTARITTSGVKVNYCYYSCPALRVIGNIGLDVAVRYDPFNMGIAFVYLNKTWHECRSEYFHSFKNRSEKEIQFAGDRLREKYRFAGRQEKVNALRLAEFLVSAEAEEMLEMQRLHQLESESARKASSRVVDSAVPADIYEDTFDLKRAVDVVPYEPRKLEEF